MKLNKDTKQFLEIGDILKDNHMTLKILTIQSFIAKNGNNCMNITWQDLKDKRVCYLMPSSQLYGMEIVKPDYIAYND